MLYQKNRENKKNGKNGKNRNELSYFSINKVPPGVWAVSGRLPGKSLCPAFHFVYGKRSAEYPDRDFDCVAAVVLPGFEMYFAAIDF